MLLSSEWTVSSVHYDSSTKGAKTELDSHADTTVTGSTCKVLEIT